MPGGFFGPDGKGTKFFESIPVIGYVASLGHAIKAGLTDDDEHLHRARRAFASSTKNALVTGATIGGTIVCGPAGAVAGAAIGSTTGQLFEKTVNETIEEPLQTSSGCFHNSHPLNFVAEVLVETGTASVCAGIAPVGQLTARSIVGTGGGATRCVARKAVENGITVPSSQIYKHSSKKLVDGF